MLQKAWIVWRTDLTISICPLKAEHYPRLRNGPIKVVLYVHVWTFGRVPSPTRSNCVKLWLVYELIYLVSGWAIDCGKSCIVKGHYCFFKFDTWWVGGDEVPKFDGGNIECGGGGAG